MQRIILPYFPNSLYLSLFLALSCSLSFAYSSFCPLSLLWFIYFSLACSLSVLGNELLKILTKWLSWLPIVGFPYWKCCLLYPPSLLLPHTQPQSGWNNSLTPDPQQQKTLALWGAEVQNNEISKWELRKVYCNLLPELRNEIVLHAVRLCVCVCIVEHFNLAVNLILINTINVTIEVHTQTNNNFSFQLICTDWAATLEKCATNILNFLLYFVWPATYVASSKAICLCPFKLCLQRLPWQIE